MKKLFIFLFVIFSILCVSCEFDPPKPKHITLEVRGWECDIYWQMIKDGGVDTGEYRHYPTYDTNYYDLEPGDGYTLRFYIVTNTIIDGNVEKRIIGDTYETHIVIDHWFTSIMVTYGKENGLGCKVEKNWEITN